MKVSVIVPTYNRANLLPNALNSLLAQTRPPDEIIVVDDGSTDNTPEVLSRFNVKAIRRVNGGLSAARNTGIDAAQGDYLMFLDDDDCLPPHSIDCFLQSAADTPRVAVIYADTWLIDPQGNKLGRLSEHRPALRKSGTVFSELALHNLFTVNAALVNRACLGDLRFDESLRHGLEDYDLWLRLAAKYPFKYIDEPLAYYSLHGSSMSRSEDSMLDAEITVQRRVFDMPRFARLTAKKRARLYCSHGIKNAMRDRLDVARGYFGQAVRTSPSYLPGYVLMLSSLLGRSFLRRVIMARRQAAGNRSWQQVMQQNIQQNTEKVRN